jgi:hypothetical protein
MLEQINSPARQLVFVLALRRQAYTRQVNVPLPVTIKPLISQTPAQPPRRIARQLANGSVVMVHQIATDLIASVAESAGIMMVRKQQ